MSYLKNPNLFDFFKVFIASAAIVILLTILIGWLWGLAFGEPPMMATIEYTCDKDLAEKIDSVLSYQEPVFTLYKSRLVQGYDWVELYGNKYSYAITDSCIVLTPDCDSEYAIIFRAYVSWYRWFNAEPFKNAKKGYTLSHFVYDADPTTVPLVNPTYKYIDFIQTSNHSGLLIYSKQ